MSEADLRPGRREYAEGVVLRCSILALLAAPALSVGATPPDLSGDPLIRAGWVATQATYNLEVETTFDWIQAGGKRLAGGSIKTSGLAFGVAKGGLLATAAHLAAPSPQQVAVDYYQRVHPGLGSAADWGKRTRARAVGLSVTRRAARVLPDGDVRESVPAELPSSAAVDPTGDVAIVQIGDPDAPALDLAAIRRASGRVVVVGLTRNGALSRTPSYAIGNLGAVRITSDYADLVGIDAAVHAGDSGGPVLDGNGLVIGLVSQWVSSRPGGGIASSKRIDDLVRRIAAPGSNESAKTFRAAMGRLWVSDFAEAEKLLTKPSLTGDPLARFELGRIEGLRHGSRHVASDRRLSRGLIAFSIASIVAAMGFLLAARRRDPPAAPKYALGSGTGREPGEPDDGMSSSSY